LTIRPIFPSAPGITAAIALGVSDVLAKVIIAARCDVLTMLSFRSIVGLAFMAAWLCVGPKPRADARVRWISLGVGVLFAGLIFCLFKAIEAIDVPTAILTYFAYPLLTGLVASATGLERLRWQGAACAVAAFCGLAIMIGARSSASPTGSARRAAAPACSSSRGRTSSAPMRG
jgi:probable blue pigment (indigoidine) exporter